MNQIPGKVKEIIDEHIAMIESSLPNSLEAYYIYGSISLGGFDYGLSDIDFITILKRKTTETDIDILKKIHNDMQKKFSKTILDGMYLLKDDIESLKSKREIPCLRFNDGEYKGIKTFDRNSIDAFELKKYGITIKGQEIENLEYIVDFDILINKMRDNLNTYGLNWYNRCRKFPSLNYIALFLAERTVEWGVLGVSRLYYTFKESNITTKVGAGEYVLQTVPHKWHKIIKESMRLRKGKKKSYYNSIFERRNDALGYIDYIIKESNSIFDKKK